MSNKTCHSDIRRNDEICFLRSGHANERANNDKREAHKIIRKKKFVSFFEKILEYF